MLKQLVKSTLLRFGYELKNVRVPSGWHPANLRKPGFDPRTIVDVGAGFGTLPLYEAFPESYHVLIEPLKEHESHLNAILDKYRGQQIATAIGAREGTVFINIQDGFLTKSSIRERTALTSVLGHVERREIPITTLDALMDKQELEPPFGLKIDTEGFELQVIEGAAKFLRETQFVIAEVSVSRRFEDSYSFAEFIELMRRNGFRLCDILSAPRTVQTEVIFVDGVFSKDNTA